MKKIIEEGIDRFITANGTEITFHCIKHGSFSMQVGEIWFYIDPVGKALEPVTDFSQMPKADYILVTHDHYDHLDAEAIADLYKPGTKIIMNSQSAEALRQAAAKDGLSDRLGAIITLENDHRLYIEDSWLVYAVPAYNYSEEKLNFHPQGRDNGYVLTLDGFRVYIAGDTEDIPQMAQIKDIDVAFLPCNLPYTMTPEQCASAARMIQPHVLFPYHYGDTDIQRVATLLSDTDIDVRIRQYQ